MQTLWRAFSQNLSFSLHVLVGTFAILRPSQNPSSYLQITYRSPPQARKPGILTAAPPSLLKLREPASRPSDCLTVGRGAGPRNAPRAPPPAGARASRGLEGPLPKAAADWLLGRSATRAFRDGAGGGRFHHKPRACKWRLGDKERGVDRESRYRSLRNRSRNPGSGPLGNAGPKEEEEEVARDGA